MLVVVNQPHTEGFRVEGNVPASLVDYLRTCYGYENVDTEDDYSDFEEMDWYKELRAQTTPGDNLRTYRRRDGLTQAQLADRLRTTRQDVSGMERGTRPISKKTAKELASLFGTSPSRFI